MDEFQPEDELKPDASDRPAARNRKPSAGPKLPVSKQHIMIAVGILVLLLLILGIGSALKSPSGHAPAAPASSSGSAGKDIDLSGTSAMSGQSAPASAAATETPSDTETPANNASAGSNTIAMPAISSTPSQAAAGTAPADQQRITVAGGINSALNNTQVPAESAAATTSLPLAPATLDRSGKLANPIPATGQTGNLNAPANKPSVVHRTPQNSASQANERKTVAAERERQRENRRSAERRRTEEQRRAVQQRQAAEQKKTAPPVASATVRKHEPVPPVTRAADPARQLPAGQYTLQLSGATHEAALNTWAKQQQLGSYHIYQTQRNGQPWFVLVSGSYATPAKAKRAISALPDAVRAKSPWVKPVSQVKKEAGK